jgi:hypothetical protein
MDLADIILMGITGHIGMEASAQELLWIARPWWSATDVTSSNVATSMHSGSVVAAGWRHAIRLYTCYHSFTAEFAKNVERFVFFRFSLENAGAFSSAHELRF